jgi:hypothetical protein
MLRNVTMTDLTMTRLLMTAAFRAMLIATVIAVLS